MKLPNDTPSQREADLRLIRIEEGYAELHDTNARILSALDGPEAEYVDGRTYRLREQGLVYQTTTNGTDIKWIKRELRNGIKTKPPKSIRVAVVTASGAIVAASIPTLVDIVRTVLG
jgi:hypothetical protein